MNMDSIDTDAEYTMTQQPHITHPIPEQWCLVFADYPLGEPAMDAIQGPLFFSSKREALIEYLKYLSPRLEQEGGLGEFLDALSDLGMAPKTLVADTSAALLSLAETIELEILEGICAGYSQNATSEGREVIFLLEAVPPARQPTFPPVSAPTPECRATDTTPTEGTRVYATFHPQAWQNDNAVGVDPGPTQIDVTPEVLAMDRSYVLAIRDNTQESDNFIHARLAPEWVRDWQGPFYIECQDSIQAFFAGTAIVDNSAVIC
ncbi:hypothetical protein [Pseudomonas sp. On1]|uniref:hypothetical protein n=1 Tax=Pseudomonas sp. On1 TaxID=3083258 RepID=UPI0029B7C0C1|nr:hypothetical protein [Pseudomonas sp. On1]MDX2309951.1 hypothetical protein [Pseudomonas sp. On1]